MPSSLRVVFCFKSYLFILALLTCLHSKQAYAQCQSTGPTCTLVAHGTPQTIDKHGTCKIVTNNTPATTIMVPHNTAAEWTGTNGFISRKPATVDLADCGPFSAPLYGSCSAYNDNCDAITNTVTALSSGSLYFYGYWEISINGGAWASTYLTSFSISTGDTLRFKVSTWCGNTPAENISMQWNTTTTITGTTVNTAYCD